MLCDIFGHIGPYFGWTRSHHVMDASCCVYVPFSFVSLSRFDSPGNNYYCGKALSNGLHMMERVGRQQAARLMVFND